MIGIAPVETAVKYTIFSGYLLESRPSSIMLLAASGEGKSDCLLQYKPNPSVFVLNDMTRWGLWARFKEALARNPSTAHCIVPDFSQVMMQNPSYTGAICSTMMSLMEEGTDSVLTKNIRHEVPNTRLGFLTSMAKDDYEAKLKDSRSVLMKTGFMSRFVVLSYRYTTETAVTVARAISAGNEPEPIILNLPLAKVDVTVDPAMVLDFFPEAREDDARKGLDVDWTDVLVGRKATDTNLIPRRIKQYRTLLKSIALSNGRRSVTEDDVKELRRLHQFLNTSFNPL